MSGIESGVSIIVGLEVAAVGSFLLPGCSRHGHGLCHDRRDRRIRWIRHVGIRRECWMICSDWAGDPLATGQICREGCSEKTVVSWMLKPMMRTWLDCY